MFGGFLDSINNTIQVIIEAMIIYFIIAFIEKRKSNHKSGIV